MQPPGTVTQIRHWITSLENRVSPAAASVTTRRRALFPLGVPRGSSPAPVSKRSREAGSRAGRSSWFAVAARRGVLPRFGDCSPRGMGSRLQRDASGLPNLIIALRCGSSNTKNPGTRIRFGTGCPWTYSLAHQGPIRRGYWPLAFGCWPAKSQPRALGCSATHLRRSRLFPPPLQGGGEGEGRAHGRQSAHAEHENHGGPPP